MDTFEYAKIVVSESLKSRPRYQVWAGSYIWTAWIVTSLIPMRLMVNFQLLMAAHWLTPIRTELAFHETLWSSGPCKDFKGV
jgi:hypothetical protein